MDLYVAFWSAISFLADWQCIVVLVLLVMGILVWCGLHRDALIFGASLFLSESVTFLLKVVIQRPRPLDGLVLVDDPYSFPSGHATIVIAFYGMLATLLWIAWKNKKHYRHALVVATALVITLVGVSRVALGVHYISDVLGGYVLGAFFWWLFIVFRRRLLRKK